MVPNQTQSKQIYKTKLSKTKPKLTKTNQKQPNQTESNQIQPNQTNRIWIVQKCCATPVRIRTCPLTTVSTGKTASGQTNKRHCV